MRLRFFYGWVIVAVVFVTMGIGVNARTAFSLRFPPILDEFGWERGVTAGAFSFGFLIPAGLSPALGRVLHDASGSYAPAFIVAIVCCILSTLAIWLAAPRKVRAVAGRIGIGRL